MKKRQDSILFYSGLIASGLLVYFWVIPNYIRVRANAAIGPDLFPRIITLIIIALSAIGIFIEQRAMKKEGESFADYKINPMKYLPQVILLASGAAFLFAAPILGFLISAIIFMFFLLNFFGSTKLVTNIILSVVYPTAMYFLFSGLLGIRFPPGIFGI